MKYVMKYSTHLLTLFTLCLCMWAVVNRSELSAIQLAMAGFSVFITLHEWEEMHFPGGFMEMMGGMIGWDMSGIRPGAQHYCDPSGTAAGGSLAVLRMYDLRHIRRGSSCCRDQDGKYRETIYSRYDNRNYNAYILYCFRH